MLPRSDGEGEFAEDGREPISSVDIHAEFVVSAIEILHERVPGTGHPRLAISLRPRIGRSRAFRRP